MKIILFISALLCILSCKETEETKEKLGEVRINVSGKAKAIPQFEKGLLLLHSFEYEDARESFQKAKEIDPNMPMAYWGEAMTYNHSLWSDQDYDKASEVLLELHKINYLNTSNELELDLINAVKILYKPKSEKPDRDVAYSDYMKNLTRKYPNNHEVAAFYALSLLGSVPDGRDETIYGQGAQIAQGILKENPNHPGALHYLIHSYDDPKNASLALEAAHTYAKVAPDASHALHMPSHIFVAMGMWDNVIASNIDSYEASITRMNAKKLDNDARGYHAYHWLEYGYLQKGNLEKAKEMVANMQQYTSETPSKKARAHLIFLKGTYLVDTNKWDDEVADISVDISDLNISIRSQHHFIEGMKAFSKGNKSKLDSIIKVTDNDYNRGKIVAKVGSAKMCSNVNRGDITPSDLTEALVRKHQLEGLLADLNNDIKLAELKFKQSIEFEESLSFSYGPPHIQKPTRELYGDWLLQQNRKKEALEQYEGILKRAPKRKLAVKGIENSKIL